MASGTKIKYAKLRLFKPSPSGSKSKPAEDSQENGESSQTPSEKSIHQMEQEAIDLVDSDEEAPAAEEPIIKRTRLGTVQSPEKPKLQLPKLPRKPPEGEGIISKFFKTSEDDFEPDKKQSQAPKTKTKVQRKAAAPRKPRAPRKPKDQSDIRKAFQKFRDNDELLNQLMLEHSVADRIDPEQLQLALAMSRSLVDQKGDDEQSQQEPEPSASSSSIGSASSEERRLHGIRTTLEQYGFKCKNSYTDYDLNVIFGNNAAAPPKNVRRIKHNRPTMLVRRTREELVTFMSKRAERLLEKELCCELKDCTLVDLHARTYGSNVFWMSSHPEHTSSCLSEYYVEDLVEKTTVNSGYLLKDWHKIPGRERTPERISAPAVEPEDKPTEPQSPEGQEIVEDPEDSLLDMNSVSDEYRLKYDDQAPVHHQRKCSPSPDLFASDSGEEPDVARGKCVEEVEETSPSTPAEEVFVTAPEIAAAEDGGDVGMEVAISDARLCTSSENIFDDSDPIVDFEVYSSEEAKISATGAAECSPSESLPDPIPPEEAAPLPAPTSPTTVLDDHQTPDEDAVISLSSGDSNISMEDRKRPSEVVPESGIPTKEQRLSREDSLFPSPGRELSFHALAIRDRLSRITLTDVETIQLEEEEDESVKGDEQRASLQNSKSSHLSDDLGDNDDVLVISDDEVNYSIRQDCSVLYNVSPLARRDSRAAVEVDPVAGHNEEDPDGTKVYFNMEDFGDPHPVAEHLEPSEEDTGVTEEPQKANNTMAFLDGLIAKFDLPPMSNPPTCDKPKRRSSKLDDYLTNYESPDFPDESVHEVEKTVPPVPKPTISSDRLDQEIEQVLRRAQETCTQLPSKPKPSTSGKPLQKTKSDSVLLKSKKSSPAKKATPSSSSAFNGRFQWLMEQPTEPAVERPEIEIRLGPVSPRPDYSGMSSPLLHRELYKFGLKQLSRPKAIKILNHFYDQLHPFVEVVEGEQTGGEELVPMKVEEERVAVRQEKKTNERKQLICGEGERLVRRGDGFVPEMDGEEYVLPSKPRKKTFWCPVPLNIAFYNMVRADAALRQQILRYQPIDLDAVYAHLKEIGLRYESNDLIAFLDKRCITFRTSTAATAKDSRGGGRQKKKAG